MQTITLTPGDLPEANPQLLQEELETALGFGVRVLVRQENGQVIEALLERADGLPFAVDEVAAVYAVAAAHDAAGLSSQQQNESDLANRRAEARDRLVALGADAVRLTGMPGLAGVVADIVEALNLDV